MAKYRITDFKYLYNGKEITPEEYVNYLIDDAKYYVIKLSRTAAKKIMTEDRMTAYERGSQEFYLISGGGVLSIIRNI